MKPILLMVVLAVGYVAMYRFYKVFIARKIFKTDDRNPVPSKEFEDGKDYVPTKKAIIFGHHFTSIAGTGPIVGPAIAIIWGWVPAVLWVFFGSVLMGAIHDFGSLIISMRNQGKSISDYTEKYVNRRTRFLFFLIVFIELWITIAIFGIVIASIFEFYPTSVGPVWLQIPIAMWLGYMIYKKKKNMALWSVVAVVLMYATVLLGTYMPVKLSEMTTWPVTGVWTVILLIYAFIASVLPVTLLLQPRDFINAYQLFIALGLIALGVIFASFNPDFRMVAPAFVEKPAGAPPIIPFLFITIACGAISGFHSLVSSGTSSKQVSKESDAVFVGVGSMLLESVLAFLVIIAVAAGIGLGYTDAQGHHLIGTEAWTQHYSSWAAAKGLQNKLAAFIDGAANMIETTGIPASIAVVIMGVFVASFAGTTLDTATRIQRYVITELFASAKSKLFKNVYFTTFLAVATAAALAFANGADGKGAMVLWPMFGAINQTLAALALIIITLYLRQKGGRKWLWSGIPAVFMIVVTTWATFLNELNFIAKKDWLLISINLVILLIVVWVTIEGVIKFRASFKTKNGLARS